MLCGDVLPTGYFEALQALGHPNLAPLMTGEAYPLVYGSLIPNVPGLRTAAAVQSEDRELSVAVVGLGPVGICALVSLLDLLEQAKFPSYTVFAIDPVPARREKMTKFLTKLTPAEAERVSILDIEESKAKVKGATNGRGVDAVLEVVGNNSALELAYDLIRAFGVISSVGVHTHPQFPLNGDQLYSKNVSASFGRCPVRAIFPLAVELLVRRASVLGGLGEDEMVERVVPLDQAKEAYEKFDRREWGKVVFDVWA